jgi:hypothetical protein
MVWNQVREFKQFATQAHAVFNKGFQGSKDFENLLF